MKQYGFLDAERRGQIRRLDYIGAGGARKYAMIYLPWDYENRPERRYDIFYLMHGGGGNPESWVDSSLIKNMLDRTIEAGEAEPMIVVFPTFYADGAHRIPGQVDPDYELQSVLTFQREELTERLLPAVEGAVRGYAEGTDPGSLKKARGHRGFGGFSMGGVNTWFAFSLHIDYFSVFMPLSGDSWELGVMSGSKKSDETADLLRDRILEAGFGPGDLAVYAATGTKDIAFPNLTPQIEAMKRRDDVFRFSEDFGQGNLHYLLGEDMVHSYDAVALYFYNLLPFLFPRGPEPAEGGAV